jgi:hypothetical protein
MFAKISLSSLIAGISVLALAAFPSAAYANHSWDNYHWARQSNPFTLTLRDNVSPGWDSYLATTSSDWSESSVLDTTIGGGTKTAKCHPPKSGLALVKVCNARYGKTGWLGLAKIWARGDHITRGTVKLNNTYFNRARYDKPEWRNLAMCQEVGHTLGLDHQDENLDNPNLGTCMDYTRDPDGPPSNEHPNQHDYEQLETIYAHTDNETTVGTSAATNRELDSQGRGYNRQKEHLFVVPVAPTPEHTEGVGVGEGKGLKGDDGNGANLGSVPSGQEHAPKNVDVAPLPRLVGGELDRAVAPGVGQNQADHRGEASGEEGYVDRPTQSGREQVPPEKGNAREDGPINKKEEQDLHLAGKADREMGEVREPRLEEREPKGKHHSLAPIGHN